MLDPKDMTASTLMATLVVYSSMKRTQPQAMTDEDRAHELALIQEHNRRLEESRQGLEDGLYGAKVYENEPHKGLLWRFANGHWDRMTIASEHDSEDRENVKSPETFYGVGWKDHVVRLGKATDYPVPEGR